MPMPRPLNPRQLAFAQEWLTGQGTGKRFNAAAAHEFAYGPSDNDMIHYTRGSKLLKHPVVSAYIDKTLAEAAMSVEEILYRLTDIARNEVGDVVEREPIHGSLKLNTMEVLKNKRFIKNFKFDSNGQPVVEFHDAVDALKVLAKVRGLLKDNVEVTGAGGAPLTMAIQFVNPDGSTYNPQSDIPGPVVEADAELDLSEWAEFEDPPLLADET